MECSNSLFYGDKYKEAQSFIGDVCEDIGVTYFNGKEDLFESQFYEDNREWFETSPLATKENKYGAFVWKPQFILEAMEQLEEGDKILYIDTLDFFHPDIFKFVDDVMGDDPCLVTLVVERMVTIPRETVLSIWIVMRRTTGILHN